MQDKVREKRSQLNSKAISTTKSLYNIVIPFPKLSNPVARDTFIAHQKETEARAALYEVQVINTYIVRGIEAKLLFFQIEDTDKSICNKIYQIMKDKVVMGDLAPVGKAFVVEETFLDAYNNQLPEVSMLDNKKPLTFAASVKTITPAKTIRSLLTS
ncbi:hypothetical protein HDU79_000807, partial [Rhizoclosmatium sp. JEL0117]